MSRKTQPSRQAQASRNSMLVLVIGGIAVIGLLAFALNRSFNAPTKPPEISTAPAPNPSTATTPSTDPEEAARAAVARITPEQLKEKIDKGEVTVIDVRDADAFLAAHIPGSLHIPLARVEGEVPYLPKEKPIVTYCTWPAEESSAGAALILQHSGINDVHALLGGFDAWQAKGLPVVAGQAQ